MYAVGKRSNLYKAPRVNLLSKVGYLLFIVAFSNLAINNVIPCISCMTLLLPSIGTSVSPVYNKQWTKR